jgi:glycerol-3-phosphate dehydrogenase subunit B
LAIDDCGPKASKQGNGMDDLLIIGAGWGGLSAALFALQKATKGQRIRLIAQGIGSPIVTPGWASFLDSASGDLNSSLAGLISAHPDHPYALVGLPTIAEAVSSFQAQSAAIGLPYTGSLSANRAVRTALGQPASPTLVPPGYAAEIGPNPAFVGFAGWRDYYPALAGPALTVTLPQGQHLWDSPPTELARLFDNADFRAGVAKQLIGKLESVTALGFPAVLGLEEPAAAIDHLTGLLGRPVFEVPTLPPSVPGTRLFNKVRRYLLDHGVRFQVGHPVMRGQQQGDSISGVAVAAAGKEQFFAAKAVILATGNLYGGGLFSDDRGRVWEGIFNLPVAYEADRGKWLSANMLDSAGHLVHHFGVRANSNLQPLAANDQPFAKNLYVAGHLLAHPVNGPSPLLTSEGVALATAYKAVQMALA